MTFNLQNEIEKKLRTSDVVDLVKILERIGFDFLEVRRRAIANKTSVCIVEDFEVFGGNLQVMYDYNGSDDK
jgi:hypothetical protein